MFKRLIASGLPARSNAARPGGLAGEVLVASVDHIAACEHQRDLQEAGMNRFRYGIVPLHL